MTIEELFKKYSTLLQFEEGDPEYFIDKEDFLKVMQEYARIKCLETAKNVRHAACDKCNNLQSDQFAIGLLQNEIMNIPNQDVIPEL